MLEMLWIVVGLAGVVGLADCSGTRSQAHGKESQEGARICNQMSENLIQNVNQGENIVVSGYSLGNVMGMLLLGTKGKTEEKIRQVFKAQNAKQVADSYTRLNKIFDKIEKSGTVELNNVNAIYVDESFKLIGDYLKNVRAHFGSEPKIVDFQHNSEDARVDINSFVAEKTKHMINDLFSPGGIDRGTKFVLLNALYFKGKWEQPFDKNKTNRTGQFHLDDKNTVVAKMMHQTAEFNYAVLDRAAKVQPTWTNNGKLAKGSAYVLRMSYKGGEMDMVIILPENSKDLEHFEKKMYNVDLNSLFKSEPVQTDVILPKFMIETDLDLKEPLTKMGVGDIFEGGADFSGMTEQSVTISKALQKCVIKVDEEGSEAAAATAVVGEERSGFSSPRVPPKFHANKPFLYFITESSSGAILFSGRLIDPSEARL